MDESAAAYRLPEAHPAFRAHFTDPLCEDDTNEFGPFGSDEGSDLLYEWDVRKSELSAHTTVADILRDSGFTDVNEWLRHVESGSIPGPAGQVDAAVIIQGAGFTLLRLTGHIDEDGRRLALKALDVLIDYYRAPHELTLQRRDLASWKG